MPATHEKLAIALVKGLPKLYDVDVEIVYKRRDEEMTWTYIVPHEVYEPGLGYYYEGSWVMDLFVDNASFRDLCKKQEDVDVIMELFEKHHGKYAPKLKRISIDDPKRRPFAIERIFRVDYKFVKKELERVVYNNSIEYWAQYSV